MKNIPGSIDSDRVIISTRKHWVSFLGQALLSLFIMVVPFFIYLAIKDFKPYDFNGLIDNFLVLGFSAYYLIIITYVFAAWLSFYYNMYIVTEDEIIEITQTGFFGRRISEVSLLRVQDVSSDVKGFFQTLFGFGDVLVESAGEQSQHFVIQSVPRPDYLCAKIMSLHDELLETEGRAEEAKEGEGLFRVHHSDQTENHQNSDNANSADETTYQRLIRNEQNEGLQPVPPHEENTDVIQKLEEQAINSLKEGEVDKEHLNQGGSIDLNN